ncbi:MAG: cytochrome c peroxidase [Planctomycetota bacterium]
MPVTRPHSSRPFIVWLCTAATFGAPAVAQLGPPPVPSQNPITPAKANLGKTLFWDEQMSSTGTVACATCHTPAAGGSDPRAPAARHPGFDGRFDTPDDVLGSFGVIAHAAVGGYVRMPGPFPLREQVTRRKAPSVLMAAYNATQFWDGRVGGELRDPHTGQVVIGAGASLEAQVLEPPLSSVEMNFEGAGWGDIEARLVTARPLALATNVPVALDAWIAGRSYPDLFREVFGTPDVSAVRIAMAIATYERTLVPDQAPIDDFLRGNTSALTPQEQHGKLVFEQLGLCTLCHGGTTFARARFADVGLRPLGEDRGRYAVTGAIRDDNTFKVPSLRNVGDRAPYFHNGSRRTLEEVVDFYARGGDFPSNPFLGIQPFGMTSQDRDALLAFLRHALTDPRVAARQPPFDHPELFAAGTRAPRPYGSGSPGSQGPLRLFSPEPPLLGNPTFRLTVDGAVGGAPVALLLDQAPGDHLRLGVRLHVAMTPALLLLDFGRASADPQNPGWTSTAVGLPADRALDGVSLFLQAVAADPLTTSGLQTSPGLRVTLFAGR